MQNENTSQLSHQTRRAIMPIILLTSMLLVLVGCEPKAPLVPAKDPAVIYRPQLQKPAIRQANVPINIGRSVKGKEIMLYRFGSRGHSTLIFGAIHGDETASAYVTKQLLALLIANPSLYNNRRVAIVTVANPDGLAAQTRGNANGVDCNRNFPAANWAKTSPTNPTFGGYKPASEPETRAIILAVSASKPDRIISVHSIRGSRQCNNYDGPGKPLALLMTKTNGYPARGSIGYPTPGSFGTWAGIERKIPTVTLEIPRSSSSPKAWKNNRQALLDVIQF